MEMLFELATKTGNAGLIAFGVLGVFSTAFFGYLLKRPIVKQAASNEAFNTAMGGMEKLNKALAEHNAYLQEQLQLRDNYEAELVHQLRQARQHLISQQEQPQFKLFQPEVRREHGNDSDS